MKKLLLLTVSVLFYGLCSAQTSSLKGTVTDTINKQKLPNTVISLLRSKDSTLVTFTRANAKGAFELKNLKGGDYLLMVTYPQYADYVEAITVKDSADATVGDIALLLKANLLKEVIVKQQLGAIRMKGDTTEMVADSFKVQPNATVEDLLKKMPGIQVDKNGKITAQGETVKKVLVDGEEFFGDDPTLVTQNLRADMVDKVQVYDKKSDQAAFTGIDDGTREKTINIKMKDGKKNGYFGKVSAGGGTDGYHDSQAMINYFKNKLKLAAYGIVSNTGKTGLNWQDQGTYGDNPLDGAEYDEANGYFTLNGNGDDFDWNGRYEGQGYPLVQTGGLHFNNKWADDNQSANANYKFMQLHVNGENGSSTQYILPDTLYYTKQTEKFNNNIIRNRGNGSYEIKFDSTSSIKISADGGVDHKVSESNYFTEYRDVDSVLVTKGTRGITSTGDIKSFNSNLLWKKKLAKKGRTISFNFRENYKNTESNGYLLASNDFYSKGILNKTQVTDQYKTINNENTALDTKLTYTEPLSKISSLVFNYGVVIDNNKSKRYSFNKDNEGKYTSMDSVYSNDYKFNVFTHRGGISYALNKKKLKFNIGTNVGYTYFNQTDMRTDSTAKRNFLNWYPQASINYQFTQQRRLGLRYNGSTNQPTIQQIQPVHTNDDPLNITIGNANLKPSFRNNISLNFSDYKVFTERSIYSYISYNFTENQISNKDFVDTNGKRTTQYVNLNGNYFIYGYFDYGLKLKKLDTRVGFNANVNSSVNVNISNNFLNTTRSNSYTGGLYISKDKEKKYSFNLSASATYTNSTSSIQTSIKTKYWTYEIQPNVDIFLPLKFQIHADGDYNIRQKTVDFQSNTDVFLLNAWVGKKFMKNDALLIKASGNDLLNQNIGFNRTVNSNYISQNTYSTIRRFFMLSVVWNFTKAGTKAPTQDN